MLVFKILIVISHFICTFRFFSSLNMDETNCVFHSGDHQVFCRRGSKHAVRVDESCKSGCTLVFTVSAIGEMLPVLVVTKSKKQEQETEVHLTDTVKVVFTASSSGWMNTVLMVIWSVSYHIVFIRFLYSNSCYFWLCTGIDFFPITMQFPVWLMLFINFFCNRFNFFCEICNYLIPRVLTTNTILFKRYLHCIRPWATDPKRKDKDKFILMDNVSFHFNDVNLALMAKEDRVFLIPLPKNSTFCFQLLDAAFFKTFKYHWKNSIVR